MVIAGPTAVGKTELAIRFAECLKLKSVEAKIISADSLQIYKEFSVCTAKPSRNQLGGLKHYFINHISITESYNVARFVSEAKKIISEIVHDNGLPMITGGTGLYIDALIENFQFASADLSRSPLKSRNSEKLYDCLKIGINFKNRAVLYDRINKRVDKMFVNGLIEEIKYINDNFNVSQTAAAAIGYKEVSEFLNGKMTLSETCEIIKKKTRHYAKRQITWFKRNTENWIYVDELSEREVLREVETLFNNWFFVLK
jgi:tRNA dimethylallyltransferase